MRIHSDKLSRSNLVFALEQVVAEGRAGRGVYLAALTPHGSQKRDHAFEVRLASVAKEAGSKRRRPNSGTRGRGGLGVWAALYDEWGWFISALFADDPDAIVGPYNGVEDFDRQTGGKFSSASTTDSGPRY
jgi:hypothetical protein